MLPSDPLRRILYIDLSRRRSWVQERADSLKQHWAA
jgi:hypothetical protein